MKRKEKKGNILYKQQHGTKFTESMLAFIDLKDPRTARHSETVADYALAIGKECELPGDQLDKLYQAGLLHDVGKIMIDNCVLNNREPLSERESLQIKSHAEKGMRILTIFSMPTEIVDVAWHHHENWDGSGYPDGLPGRAVLPLTKIIRIADSVAAMSEDRPYRKHLTDEEIIDELRKGKGKYFDPEITNVAIKVIMEKMLK